VPADAAALLAEALISFRPKMIHTPRGGLEVQIDNGQEDFGWATAFGANEWYTLGKSDESAQRAKAAKLASELTAAGLPSLRHVEAPNDRSAPTIDSGVHIGKSSHGALLDEIKRKASAIATLVHRRGTAAAIAAAGEGATQRLRKAPVVSDRSGPLIPDSVTIRPSTRPALLGELRDGLGRDNLKHVEAPNDRSAPVIDTEVRIERSVRSAVLDELRKKVGGLLG